MKLLKALIVALYFVVHSVSANAYVPMLDETDAPGGNVASYLILPAWENTLPGATKHAYFIVPKYLAIAGTVDPSGPQAQFGVQHRGFTLLPNGDADWPPTVRVIATVELYRNDVEIKKLQDGLTKRDIAAGLQPPDFPPLVFSKFKASANIGGVSSTKEGVVTQVASTTGGAPGQPLVFDFLVPGGLTTSFVFDLPPKAGRNSALWGVTLFGTIPGYANRLKCTIFMDHKKIYTHFKARASGQAYWGLVKADLAYETQSMDQDQSIDFGACRGSPDQIEKLVMPIWTKILEISDQDGNKMFAAMIQKSAGIPGHPEASDVGWGFQASSGFERVDYHDSTTINFDISYRGELEIPFGMTFPTVCPSWKNYFINGSDPSKACVSVSDYQQVKSKNIQCYKDNVQMIKSTYDSEPDIKKKAFARLEIMGCAYDGGFGPAFASIRVANIDRTGYNPRDAKRCRAATFSILSQMKHDEAITPSEFNQLAEQSDSDACGWRPAATLLRDRVPDSISKFDDSISKALRR